MEENKESFDLFDRVPGNDWQIVDGSEAPKETDPGEEAPRPAAAPQIWDDIPREDPEVKSTPEAEAAPQVAETIPPAVETPVAMPEVAETPNAPETQVEAPAASQDAIPDVIAPEIAEPAPAEPVIPDDAIPPAEEIAYRYVAPAEISTLAEIGHYLASIRQKENLSAPEVSEATKIRGDYLAAIEEGDASELPQAVYVLAYIRKLCELYRVDTANLGDFFADLRDGFSYELPEDINKSIIGHENDEEQQKKMRQLAIGLISAAAIVIIALVIGAVTLIVTLTGNRNGGACTTSDRKIIEYQGKPTLYLQKLPAGR